MESTSCLLSTAYLAPVQYYSKLATYTNAYIEHQEFFPKQTYRNRAVIYGANGALNLTIPIKDRSNRTLTKDAKIAYHLDWQKLHWRSLEAAYRSTPYFEYYQDDFYPFYTTARYTFLIDFNAALLEATGKLIKLKSKLEVTSSYIKDPVETADFRNLISPKSDPAADYSFTIKPYPQLFDTKYGFIPNLSIVDLLFNQGPDTKSFL